MYLLYVDESGDTGHVNSPTNHFVLSAIVFHEDKWLDILDNLIGFRRYLKSRYGLAMKEEIHASEWLNKNPKLKANIPKHDRLDILKKCLKWLDLRNVISIYTVCCNKPTNRAKDIFDYSWKVLIQRFDNTLAHNNFPGGNGNDKGIIIPDDTQGQKLTRLLRSMRRVNYIPSQFQNLKGRNIRLRAIIEDPIMRNSANSYFHQMVDVVAFFGRMYYEPNRYTRKKGARTFYNFISSVVNPHVTKKNTYNSIVEI